MRVRDLEDLLARLPDDMLVHVAGAGIGAFHVTLADKQPRKRAQKITYIDGEPCPPAWRGRRGVLIPGDGSDVLPPSLILRGREVPWFLDEPDFTLAGRWPAPRPLTSASIGGFR